MTPRERMTLLKLAVHVGEQGHTAKDVDVERELAAMLKARPDAAYLLLLRCLALEAALDEAQSRIGVLQPLAPFAAAPHAAPQAGNRGAARSAPVPAPATSGLRDLLGEWTSTTLLSELADDVPPAKGPGKGWGNH